MKNDPTNEEMEARVKRTQSLMKVGASLREYRDLIDDIILAINSDEGFHSELADSCIDMGLGMQGIASTLRRLSLEGDYRDKLKKAKGEWIKTKAKMSRTLEQEEFKAWLEMFSKKMPKGSHQGKKDEYTYYGPNHNFIESYVDVEDENT